jgi:hypothetical protein
MLPDEPKYFKKIKLGKNGLRVEEKKKILKIQVIIFILCAISDSFLKYL